MQYLKIGLKKPCVLFQLLKPGLDVSLKLCPKPGLATIVPAGRSPYILDRASAKLNRPAHGPAVAAP